MDAKIFWIKSNLNYEEFASAFGVEDVLSLSSSVNGAIADQYII